MSAQKKKTLIIVCAAVVLVAAMLAVWFAFGPKGTAGQKAVGVTVVYADATTDEFSFSTDAEFLRQALEEQKLVEGEESQYGLYKNSQRRDGRRGQRGVVVLHEGRRGCDDRR